MLKNKLPISSILGLGLMFTGGFFLFLFGDIADRSSDLGTQEALFLIVGLFSCFTGILLFLKIKWARTLVALSLITLSLSMLSITIRDFDNLFMLLAFLCLFVGLPFFLLLLLYNQKVSEEFGIKHQDKIDDEILDIIE